MGRVANKAYTQSYPPGGSTYSIPTLIGLRRTLKMTHWGAAPTAITVALCTDKARETQPVFMGRKHGCPTRVSF